MDFIPEAGYLLECELGSIDKIKIINDICNLGMEDYEQLKLHLIEEISKLGSNISIHNLNCLKKGRATERLIEWVVYMISEIQHGARIKFYEKDNGFLTLSRLFLAEMPTYIYNFQAKILELD